MAYFPASWQDWWRRQKKLQDPSYLARHPSAGPAYKSSAIDPAMKAHSGLVADPMANWGSALEAFYSWQVSSGFDILRSGSIETASDAQNVSLAQQTPTPSLASPSAVPIPAPAASMMAQPWHRPDPYNCPFSTIPGAPGPMKPPKMPGM